MARQHMRNPHCVFYTLLPLSAHSMDAHKIIIVDIFHYTHIQLTRNVVGHTNCRATVTGNMHKNLVKIGLVVLKISDRTDRQTGRNTLLLYRSGIKSMQWDNMKLGSRFHIASNLSTNRIPNHTVYSRALFIDCNAVTRSAFCLWHAAASLHRDLYGRVIIIWSSTMSAVADRLSCGEWRWSQCHIDVSDCWMTDNELPMPASAAGRHSMRHHLLSCVQTMQSVAQRVWRTTLCLNKKTPDIFRCNSSRRCWFLTIFGRNVCQKTCN